MRLNAVDVDSAGSRVRVDEIYGGEGWRLCKEMMGDEKFRNLSEAGDLNEAAEVVLRCCANWTILRTRALP